MTCRYIYIKIIKKHSFDLLKISKYLRPQTRSDIQNQFFQKHPVAKLKYIN